ncbi:methyltransferase, TIGR04325 family [Sediminibacterium sp.]|uniref:methyltransferase, TIGR04325 family n=1 Tax=Sediminibacterium sp. TaxID=1917865 RepID=UPI002735DB4A|nr:methyltransferase, TIGR04325 family [Sediminibacterium sp.]MDP3567663.1 methyltransferase, TIGR04325 family [Sediminibacterium sp.]
MNIKDFIPPIILKVKNKILGKQKVDGVIEEEYESYQSAQTKCVNGDYQNVELCDMIAEKTIVYKDSLIQQPNSLTATNVFLLAAINNIRITDSLKSMTILDFGGACGAHFFEIRKFLPETFNLKWIVVETPQMVLSAKTKFIETKELIFLDNMNNLPPIDFIYSSSTLQYTAKPYEFLENLLKVGANSILFNRMMFNENDRDLITIQKSSLSNNGPGPMPKQFTDKIISYPHTTLSFNKFNSVVLKSYNLTWVFNEATGSYKIGNESIIGRGLFYTKIS